MLLKNFTTVSFHTALSRISGFVRDIFIAKYLGAGPISDAFFIALRVPNFFRRFFAEGALNSAFIPLFSRKLGADGRDDAVKFAEEIFALLFITLVIFSSIFMLFMPYLIYVIAPGLMNRPEIQDLTIELTRITFPYLMMISIATIFASILNSISKFSAVAFMPVLFNMVIILTFVVFGSHFQDVVHALAWGVFFSGIIQIIWMIYFLHRNDFIIRLKLRSFKMSADVKEFIQKVTPAAIGGGVVQINLWVDLMVASFFSGAVTYLYYADRVAQLPLSIIGTAMGTALLPSLSRSLGSGQNDEASKAQETGLEVVLFLTLPAALALLFLSHEIMQVLFVRGEFTIEDARLSAYAMAAFACGLPAFALIKIFSTSFFALKDTKTPVVSACIAMCINIALNILFVITFQLMEWAPHIGIALATSISGWINAAYLARKLFKTTHFSLSDIFWQKVRKITISTAVMGFVLLILITYFPTNIVYLAIEVAAGGAVYMAAILIQKTFPLDDLKKLLRRKNRAA